MQTRKPTSRNLNPHAEADLHVSPGFAMVPIAQYEALMGAAEICSKFDRRWAMTAARLWDLRDQACEVAEAIRSAGIKIEE